MALAVTEVDNDVTPRGCGLDNFLLFYFLGRYACIGMQISEEIWAAKRDERGRAREPATPGLPGRPGRGSDVARAHGADLRAHVIAIVTLLFLQSKQIEQICYCLINRFTQAHNC
jgi:hypothetical protein